MKHLRLMGICLILIGTLLSGCSDFHVVKPDNPTMIQAETTPLPLVAGIRVMNQRLTGGFSDMGPTFASHLTNSNLFKSVLYPVRSDDKLDLVIDFTGEGKLVVDGAMFPKAFITGLLLWLPAPIIEYEHHYKASATVRFASQNGQQIKNYEVSSNIPVRMKIRAPATEVQDQGVKAATDDLMDQIVIKLQRDKAYLSGLREETK